MTKRFTAKTTILLCCLVVLFVCTFLCAQFIAPAQADSPTPTFIVLDGKTPSGDAASTQSYDKLFDGSTDTKYCVKLSDGPYVVFKSLNYATIITSYTFVTGNDTYSYDGRNPKDWGLYGCNDYDEFTKTGHWKIVNDVTNDTTLGKANKNAYTFTVDSANAYKYYRFTFKARRGSETGEEMKDSNGNTWYDDNIQLSEIRINATCVANEQSTAATAPTHNPNPQHFIPLDGRYSASEAPGNTYNKLFDGEEMATEYWTYMYEDLKPWVIFKAPLYSAKVTGYRLWSAASYSTEADRRPRSWKLYGCNNYNESSNSGGSWSLLHEISAFQFGGYSFRTFTVENTQQYKYYKFEFTEREGEANEAGSTETGLFALSEIEMISEVDVSQSALTGGYWNVNEQSTWCDGDKTTYGVADQPIQVSLSGKITSQQAIVYGAVVHFAEALTEANYRTFVNGFRMTGKSQSGSAVTLHDNLYTSVSSDRKTCTFITDNNVLYNDSYSISFQDSNGTTLTSNSNFKVAEIELLYRFKCDHWWSDSFTNGTVSTCSNQGVRTYRTCLHGCGACQYYDDTDTVQTCELNQFYTKVLRPLKAHTVTWNSQLEQTPTCGTAGYYKNGTCSDCNMVVYEADGKTYTCTDAHRAEAIAIPATGNHTQKSGTLHNASQPSCDTPGNYKYYECLHCGEYVYEKDGVEVVTKVFDEVNIPKTNHVWSTEQIIAEVTATCTATGTKAHWHCNQCNKDYDTDKSTVLTSLTITALGHTYGEWTSYSAPTCTATGNYAYRQCSACDEYQYIEDLTITNYDAYVAGSSHPALKTCASAEFDSKIKLAKVDHVFGDWVSFKDFTCTEDGNWWHHKCTQCDLYEYFIYPVASCDPDEYLAENPGDRKTTTDYSDITENLSAHHVWGSTTPAKNASCTEDGNYEWQKCNICKGYQYKIGETTYFCASDEFDTKVKLPKHHTWGAVVQGTAPNCDKSGTVAYRQCTVCNVYQFKKDKYTADANYFDTTTDYLYIVNSTDDFYSISVISHNFTKVKDYKAPTCTEEGNIEYYYCDQGCDQYKYIIDGNSRFCSATEENYNTNIRRNKLEHSYDTLIAEEPANCTAKGLAAHYVCSKCHYLFDANKVQTPLAELELPINPNNHVFATTCTKKCSYCTYERDENERVHKYDTDDNACLYNGVTDKHAYFCTNDHCTEGVLYEDHTMVLVCAQDRTWQHWYKCSKSGCSYETSKVACVIKYENKDADKHVSYCEVDGVRHELGENGAVNEENHDWTTDYVFNQAKCDAGEGNFHAKKCEKCGVFAQNQEACDVVYYTEDDTDHWQICYTCRHKLSDDEPHTYVMVYDEIEHWEECSVCGKIKDDGYFYHTFASATSTSCSEEGCGYQRFLKANFTINGYAIDALVGGITASATTDRTDANLSLVQYELYNSDIGKIDFAESKTDAKMTFRPNTVYYALMFFDCGDVYPSNDMTAADFTLPKGFEYGYFDIGNYPREDGTYYVRMTLTVVLSPLGGVSAEKSVSEMEIDLKNFQAGKKFGDVVIDITCKGLPTDKSFTIGNKSYSDVAGSTITDETAIAATAYSIITIVTAPEGFNFYGLTDSDVTVKNDMGTVYLMPMEEGKISRDGKTIMIIIVINGLVPEHVCGADGWEVVDSYYDFFGVDKSTQHTQMCKTCGAIEFVNHVFDNDFDIICDDCEYERMLKLDEMHFTLTGYQADAQLKGINVTYSGKYASTETVTCIGKPDAMIVDLDTQSSYSKTATFVPGKAYGILIEIKIPSAIDTSSCTLDNVYVNNTKVKVIMGMGNGSTYYYVLQLPAVTGESKQTKVSDVNLEVSGFIHGTNLGTVALDKLDTHPAIASYTASVTQNGNSMSISQAFAYGNQYVLTVVYTLKDGYYGMGVTADDLKVSHYAVDSNSQKIDLGNFECISITVDDFGDDNTNNRTITCKYLVELVVPQDVEDHTEGHVFPTENVKYHTDENKHYVLCGCGAHDEGEEHVYDDDDVFVCSVCGYVRVYSVENMQFEFDWRVGNHIWYIIRKMNMSVNGSEVVFDENGYTNLMLFIEGAMLYEGTITDISAFQYLDESEVVLANKSYTLVMLFAYANEYLDCGALAEKDYTITGIGETPITASYVLNFNMGSRTTAAAVIFNIPAIEAKHVHGGTWIDEVPATCTEIGTKGHYVCTICGDSFDADDVKIDDLTILAPGHNFSTTEIIAQVPATCTTTGTKAHWHCGTCNKDFDTDKSTVIDDLTIQALGHTYGTWIAEEPATCTNTGMLAHYECSVCHTLFDENKAEKTAADLTIAINSTAHKFGTWIDEVPATLEKDGTVAHKDCEYCHKHFDANNEEISGDDLTIAKIAGYNLIFKIDGEEVAKHYLAQGSAVTYPTSGSKQGFTFAWSQTIQTMPASDVTIEGIFAIDVNYFKSKVDAVQNATTVEDIYSAIVSANTALALYDGMDTQSIGDQITRLDTLTTQYKQMAQTATSDVTNAVNVVSAVFGALVQMAIVALATVIVKRRLF